MPGGNLLRKLASPVRFVSGSYARGWSRGTESGHVAVVLVYHRVAADAAAPGRFDIENGVPARVFERQIRFMLKHFDPVECSRVLEARTARISFAVSFDDGYHDNYSIAAPILRRLGVPAAFFVVSDFVGTERLFWWEQLAEMMRATRVPSIPPEAVSSQLGARPALRAPLPLGTAANRRHAYEALCSAMRSLPGEAIADVMATLSNVLDAPVREAGRDDALMNWEELRALSRQGFEIGGHTASHCNVPLADARTLHREIVGSARIIENELQKPVLTFAYPYGISDPAQGDAERMLETANCRVAFTGSKGAVTGRSRAYALPRGRLNRTFRFVWAYNVQDALDARPANS